MFYLENQSTHSGLDRLCNKNGPFVSSGQIAVYDDLLARFGTATELPLRKAVAKAQTLKAGLHKS